MRTKPPKVGVGSEVGTEGIEDDREGPAARMRIPGGGIEGWGRELKGAIGGQAEQAIQPGGPLNRGDRGVGVVTWFVAQTEERFDFAMDDFEFKALSGPGQQQVNRERQTPLTLMLDRVD